MGEGERNRKQTETGAGETSVQLRTGSLVLSMPEDVHYIINELVGRSNDNARRLRDLEQRYKELSTRIISFETALDDLKRASALKEQEINTKFTEAMNKASELENRMNDIINQLKAFATKSEVLGLKELIDIYSPLQSKFVTREQVEEMVNGK